jgi:hypothetical protein
MRLVQLTAAVASLLGTRTVASNGRPVCKKCGSTVGPRTEQQAERALSTDKGVHFEFTIPCGAHIVHGNKFVTCDSYRAFAAMKAA